MAAASATPPSEADPAAPSAAEAPNFGPWLPRPMEADTDRPPAPKRELEASGDCPVLAEDSEELDELGLEAEQAAADYLLGDAESKPAVKKAKAQAGPSANLSANEVANKLVLQMAAKFPSGPQKETSSDLASVQAGSSSR